MGIFSWFHQMSHPQGAELRVWVNFGADLCTCAHHMLLELPNLTGGQVVRIVDLRSAGCAVECNPE